MMQEVRRRRAGAPPVSAAPGSAGCRSWAGWGCPEVVLGLSPVLLDAQVVDQGGAAGVDQEVEDGGQLLLPDHDQDQADGLQEPVHHVEPHRDKVPPSSEW